MHCLAVLLTTLELAGPPEPVDFDTQLIAVFTKAGCNYAACHGGAAGRGGFKLSLFGGDPAADYRTIVREFEGRRVDLARPGDSLIVAKPTGLLDHGGDIRLEIDSPGARLLEEWIRAGAPRLQRHRLEEFRVEPARVVLERPGETVRLRATARFDDGERRDVSRWTVFTAGDPSAVDIDEETGEVTVRRRGQTVITARYLSRVVAVEILVPLTDRPVDLSKSPKHNFIDERVLERLATLRLAPAPQADDLTFLRRARLSLTGTLPALEEIREFVSSDDPGKRAKLVDALLESDEFDDYWAFRLARLLRVRSLPGDRRVPVVFHAWLREQVEKGTRYDEVCRQLLTAEGDSHERGEAGFYRMTSSPREHAEYVSEVFLASRLKCAGCHNHPLDRWTLDDYHGLAAVFARIDRGRVVRLMDRGEVTHPRTGKAATPRIPGERFLEAARDGRRDLADWLTRPANPYFARATVNRLWKALMGRGLVEAVDDLRATNPATHPQLLVELARDFVEHGFDLRHTLRRIARSAAFARATRAAGASTRDDRFYSTAIVRPLEAEVLADAISRVTGVAGIYGELPPGTRAISLSDPSIPSVSLDILGRCARESSCESVASGGTGLATRLHVLNGPLVNGKITAEDGRLGRLLKGGSENGAIVDQFYRRALGRPPRSEERLFWKGRLDADDSATRRQALEDFLWSLLSCREFVTNH